MSKPSKKRPVKASPPAAVVVPSKPVALPLEVRRSVQGLLARIERTTPALRASGAFEVLGLLAQAGHALKLVADHALELERALGLEPKAEPAAAAKPHTNGVSQ